MAKMKTLNVSGPDGHFGEDAEQMALSRPLFALSSPPILLHLPLSSFIFPFPPWILSSSHNFCLLAILSLHLPSIPCPPPPLLSPCPGEGQSRTELTFYGAAWVSPFTLLVIGRPLRLMNCQKLVTKYYKMLETPEMTSTSFPYFDKTNNNNIYNDGNNKIPIITLTVTTTTTTTNKSCTTDFFLCFVFSLISPFNSYILLFTSILIFLSLIPFLLFHFSSSPLLQLHLLPSFIFIFSPISSSPSLLLPLIHSCSSHVLPLSFSFSFPSSSCTRRATGAS